MLMKTKYYRQAGRKYNKNFLKAVLLRGNLGVFYTQSLWFWIKLLSPIYGHATKKAEPIKIPPLINAQFKSRKKEQGMGLRIYFDCNASNKIFRRFKVELLAGN